MVKKGSEKRKSGFSFLSFVRTDNDNGLLKIQSYFWGAVVFWGFFRAKTSEIKVEFIWSTDKIYLYSKKLLLYSGQSFHYHFLPTDTAIKVQAAKDKARQANDTANDVLAQIKDLNRNLLVLRKNYSKLTDDVAKTDAVVKDPIKNSKIFFRLFGGGFSWVCGFHFISQNETETLQNFSYVALLQYAGIKRLSITSIFWASCMWIGTRGPFEPEQFCDSVKRILNLKD